MIFTLVIAMLMSPLRPVEGTATYHELYSRDYKPRFVEAWHGPQIVAPDTPYVAAVGKNQLYYIDTRFDAETAKHIKAQIEWGSTSSRPSQVISIDEVAATASVKDTATGETLFEFDPPYARVLFARGINKRNPGLRLPEHEPAGEWLVTYEVNSTAAGLTARQTCSDYGCSSDQHCKDQTRGNCNFCHHYRVDSECDVVQVNAVGACRLICGKKADVPELESEEKHAYYKRMDDLHWN